MNRKKILIATVLLVVVIVIAVLLWFITQKPKGAIPGPGENISLEENLFATYDAETVDFMHPDDIGPNVLPPTPDNIPIHDLEVKSYDFDENKTGLMYETSADDNEWCRIKQLTPSLWAYYFDDYHYYWDSENGTRLNPDFNDVVLLVWNVDDNLRIKAIGSPSTFRNELWVGGARVFDNVEAHLNMDFERPLPQKLG